MAVRPPPRPETKLGEVPGAKPGEGLDPFRVLRKPGENRQPLVRTPGEDEKRKIDEDTGERQAPGRAEGLVPPIIRDEPSEAKKKLKGRIDERQKKGGQGRGRREDAPVIKVGELVQPGRIDVARTKGFAQTPTLAEFVAGQDAPVVGKSFAEMLPGSRVQRSDLPEPSLRPPYFLSTFEGMRDIYLQTRGRASQRTRELLEGPVLEDLVAALIALHSDEQLVRNAEARLNRAMMARLGADPGPLLIGLSDPRLSEPWRLFLEGWDIWVARGQGEGLELFWEGEAEDEKGELMELMQALRFENGEITLEAKIGSASDRITFDGRTFYRLKSDREAARSKAAE